MPRKRRLISEIFPSHVSARCINQDWFRLPIEDVWSIFCDYLYLIKFAYKIEIHNFVLMDNHFHMIISTPEANLSQAMNYFMREVSREITRQSDRINQTFGGPFHSSLIKTSHHYLHAYKYVYRNPVEAGLSQAVEQYKYSTLNGLLGFSPLIIPVKEDEVLFSNTEEALKWLNEEYKNQDQDKVRKALKKSEFAFEKDSNYGRKDELETRLS